MANSETIPAWITLFIGLYGLAASVGEMRSPGSWAAMLDEFEKSEGIRFIAGIVVLALGAVIYLVNPWQPDDWMAVMVTLIGAAFVIEGLVIFAFGRAYLHFASSLLGPISRVWPWLGGVFGTIMICAALLRF